MHSDQQGFSVAALAALALIFAALVLGGAHSGALASYLGAALMALAFIKLVTMHPLDVARLLATHALSLGAALGFVALAVASAAPAISSTTQIWPAELGSLSPYRTIEGLAAFTAPIGAFALGVFASAERGRRSWIARVLLSFAIFYSAWALVTYAPSAGIRLSAGLGSANTAACIFGMISLFALAHLARALKRSAGGGRGMGRIIALVQTSPLALAALLLASACLVLTLSRAGIFAAALSFTLLCACLAAGASSRRALIWLLIPGALAMAGAGAFVALQRSALAAGGAGDGVSYEGRKTLIEVFWRAFLDRPVFGHGLNTYHELSALNANPGNWEALRTSGSVHNIYVQTLAETGVVGFALLALAVAPALWRAARAAFQGCEGSAAALAMATLCLLQGIADFGLQTPAIAAFMAFALGAFVTTSPRRRGGDRDAVR